MSQASKSSTKGGKQAVADQAAHVNKADGHSGGEKSGERGNNTQGSHQASSAFDFNNIFVQTTRADDVYQPFAVNYGRLGPPHVPHPPPPGHPLLMPYGASSLIAANENSKMMMDMLTKLTEKLAGIEANVSKLPNIEVGLSRMTVDIQNLKEAQNHVTTKISDVEQGMNSFSLDIEDQGNAIKELKRENDHLRNSVEHVVNSNQTFHNQVTDLRCRSLQNNLLFIGVEEKRAQNSDNTTSVENCEQTLREFIRLNVQNDPHLNQNVFNIDEIQFSKEHRIGGPDAKTRPIVATFHSYRDRENLRQAGVRLNMKKSKYYINEHFPSDVEQRRKQLYPVMRILKNKGHRCNIVSDRLYVDGQPYDINKNTMHLNYQQGQRFNRPRETSAPYTQDRGRPRARPPPDNVRGLLNFETPNRYTPLRERSQSLQRVRKHKASPLEDTNYKRTCDNPNFGDDIITTDISDMETTDAPQSTSRESAPNDPAVQEVHTSNP